MIEKRKARRRRALVLVHSYYLRDTRPRRHATALADAGWNVDVICARESGEPWKQESGGVSIHRLPAQRKRGSKGRYLYEYFSFTAMALFAVTLRFLRKRHDVVYVLGVPNFLVFAAIVPRLMGARVFLDMRDPFPEFFEAKYGYGPRHPIVRGLRFEEKLSARFASRVITVHDSMAELYTRTGVPRELIGVVMNAPDPRLFAIASFQGRDPGDRTMLYTGTVAHWYGVDLGVRAVARLRDDIPGLRLRIVGDGQLIPALRALVAAEGIHDRVIFDAPVPLDRVPDIVAAAWVGIQPNRDDPLMRYSLSTKVLEWCRLGLPVVCGKTRPLVDAFGPEELMFHEPGDLDGLCARLVEAHLSPDALAARAGRAKTASQQFNYANEISKLLELVESELGYNRGTRDPKDRS